MPRCAISAAAVGGNPGRWIIHYLKNQNCFIVNDIVLPQQDSSYTMGPIFHAEQIESVGPRSFALSHSHSHISMGDEVTHQQPGDMKLFLHFPVAQHPIEEQRMDRAYQDQMSVGQYFAGYASERFPLVFTSVLCPGDRRPAFLDTFTHEITDRGLGLHFCVGEEQYTLFDRFCYESKIEDLNRRPAYSFDAGRD